MRSYYYLLREVAVDPCQHLIYAVSFMFWWRCSYFYSFSFPLRSSLSTLLLLLLAVVFCTYHRPKSDFLFSTYLAV